MPELHQPNVDEVPISFSQFVITLVQSSMVALGEVESPDTGRKKMKDHCFGTTQQLI